MERVNINDLQLAVLGSNREVRVTKEFKKSIKAKGVLMPLILVKAIDIDESIELRDIRTNEIITDRNGYYVIIDGQHRTVATLQIISEEEDKAEKSKIEIRKWEKKKLGKKDADSKPIEYHPQYLPIVKYEVISMDEIGNLNDYIIEINSQSRKWSDADYINHAHKTKRDDNLIKTIHYFASRYSFPTTSISLILCNNKESYTSKALSSYVNHGIAIRHANYERAIRLYIYLRKKKFTNKFLKKRYLLELLSKECANGGIDQILHRMEYLNESDVQKMCNLSGSDIESNMYAILDAAYGMNKGKIKKDVLSNYLALISVDEIQLFLNGEYPKEGENINNSNTNTESNDDTENSTNTEINAGAEMEVSGSSTKEIKNDISENNISLVDNNVDEEYTDIAARIPLANNAVKAISTSTD